MKHSSLFFGVTLAGAALLFAACNKTEKQTAAAPQPATPPPAAPAATATPAVKLETMEQRASYGIGYNIGSSIAADAALEVDAAAIKAGIEDGLSGAATRIESAQIQAAFMELQQREASANAAAGEKNLAEAKAFLATNGARPGVTTTASGLQYEVVVAGTGPKPTADKTVEVHYHGTLVDGTVFDSSVQRGETIAFPVTGVIPGWVEALQLMPVGSKWKLYISPELGYGARGSGRIPPNSALIFEVELIAIK